MIDLQHKKTAEDEVYVLEQKIEAHKNDNARMKYDYERLKMDWQELVEAEVHGRPKSNTIPSMPKSISEAIKEVTGGIKPLAKDGSNTYQGYTYMSVDSVLAMVGPLLAKSGLVVTVDEVQQKIVPVSGKGMDLHMIYKIILSCGEDTWQYASTEYQTVPYNGAVSKGTAQSYMLKQYYRKRFSIATGGKDEVEQYDSETDKKTGYSSRYKEQEKTVVNINTQKGVKND